MDAHPVNAWRPVPWIAAVLGLFGGGLGLLYVQRLRFAIAYFCTSFVVTFGLLYLMLATGIGIRPMMGVALGWIIRIIAAMHAYSVARAATPVAERMWYSRWYVLTTILAVLVGFTFLFRSFAYEPFNVPSESMYPTIPEGSYLFVSKWGYGRFGTAAVARGDLIAHRLVKDPSVTYLGRIVGLPGDRVRYFKRQLVINDRAVPTDLRNRDEHYQYAVEHFEGTDATVAFMLARPTRDFDEVVPPDHYAVFGDNRDNARDTRYIGFVPRDHLKGRVVKIMRPPGR